MEAEGTTARLLGYVFVLDTHSKMFARKKNRRTTIIDLAESGYIVNIVDPNVNLEEVNYHCVRDYGLVATDGKEFSLDINEFGVGTRLTSLASNAQSTATSA